MSETEKQPTLGNGKICYVEIPTSNIDASVDFYREVFGWKIRTRDDGCVAFDDGVGQVSGAWVTDRPPMTEAGLLIYIMVDSVAATSEALIANGGKIVKPLGHHEREKIAIFSDPAGNVLGLYQEP